MRSSMSFKQYRTMDLCFFTFVLCICESLIVFGATRWFPAEPYTLSLTAAVTAIVMVRWGCFAAIPALAGALVFCLTSGATAAQGFIYCAGNLGALALLIPLKRYTWKRLHDNVLFAMLYGLAAALLMQLGRFAAAVLLGMPPGACTGFITTDVLSSLFSVLLIWIARRLDGMLEEQTHYLKRIHEEEKNKAGGVG